LIDKILEDREKRYNLVLDYLKQYNLPVVCSKVNYPGTDKNTQEASMAFLILQKAVLEKFKLYSINTQILEGNDGKSFLSVVDISPLDAKSLGICIEENHELGRIFDIDVYTEDGVSIGREKINKNMRKCILCDEDARVCIKTGAHSLNQTLSVINNLIRGHRDKHENRI
jgi:holo-ACP synthase